MNASLEELASAYVARTETPGSLYFSQLVKRVASLLRQRGYTDRSDVSKVKMRIREILSEEQDKVAKAALSKARSFAQDEYDADDLVQDAWVDALEKAQLSKPTGDTRIWSTRIKQMKSPVSVPAGIVNSGDWVQPQVVELDDHAEFEAIGIYEPRPEMDVDVRDSFYSLEERQQQDLRDLLIQEEPLLNFAKRHRISLEEARRRKQIAVEALREAFDGD